MFCDPSRQYFLYFDKLLLDFQIDHGASAIAAFIDCARYLTFFSLIPAIEILPLFSK